MVNPCHFAGGHALPDSAAAWHNCTGEASGPAVRRWSRALTAPARSATGGLQEECERTPGVVPGPKAVPQGDRAGNAGLRVGQTFADRVASQLNPIVDVKLGHQVSRMAADRVRADVHGTRDLLLGHSPGDVSQDFQLSVRER